MNTRLELISSYHLPCCSAPQLHSTVQQRPVTSEKNEQTFVNAHVGFGICQVTTVRNLQGLRHKQNAVTACTRNCRQLLLRRGTGLGRPEQQSVVAGVRCVLVRVDRLDSCHQGVALELEGHLSAVHSSSRRVQRAPEGVVGSGGRSQVRCLHAACGWVGRIHQRPRWSAHAKHAAIGGTALCFAGV